MIQSVEKIYLNNLDGVSFNYKLTYTDGTVWSVPVSEDNRHYQEIQEWIADGGTVIDNGGGE
jgi:hypothetical protein